MSTVDVFVPNYNYAHYLRATIDSALAQEGVDLRVVVVDNASTDDSIEVIEAAMAADPRVHLIRHERNLGLITSLNEGLEWAKGDYAVNLSADDVLAPGWLARAVEALDGHPEAAFTFGRARLFSEAIPGALTRLRSRSLLYEGAQFISSTCSAGRNPIRSPEGVFRVSTAREAGGFSPVLPYSSDMGLWLRLASRGSVLELRGPVAAFYRMHGSNLSTGNHLQALSDLQYPLAAIEEWFAHDGELVAGSAAMVLAAKKKLARIALGRALVAFLREPGSPADPLFEQMLKFSLENDPSTLPQVMRLRRIAARNGVQVVRDSLLPLTRSAIRLRRAALAARIRRGLA